MEPSALLPSGRNPGRSRWYRLAWLGFLALSSVAFVGLALLSPWAEPLVQRLRGLATVRDRLAEHGAAVEGRFRPSLERAGVPWPAERIWLVAFKDERRLDLIAADPAGIARFIRSYPILGASGTLGPKLREGDRQVPEGRYRVAGLNPNSAYHLALRLDYPNGDDHRWAEQDGRSDLGGDIMIHGGGGSIGCLAMGDPAAEDLFVLAALAREVGILIVPVDWRRRPDWIRPAGGPVWLTELDAMLRSELASLPGPTSD